MLNEEGRMSIPVGSFPVLPLKNTVIYPSVTQALKVGRDRSIKAVDMARDKNNWVLTLALAKTPSRSQIVLEHVVLESV